MAFTITNAEIGLPSIADTLTTQSTQLGKIVDAYDPTYLAGEFIYLKGVASTVVGSWVTYNLDDGTTTLLAANAIGPVAVAMSINVANQYGWYMIQGKAVAKVSAGFVDNANLYATATPGEADDAVVAGDRIKRAKGASAIGTPSAGLAECEIDRPFMDDAVAA